MRVLFLALILLTLPLSAQSLVTPGKSAGPVSLGSSASAVGGLLGFPSFELPFATEQSAWIDAGYDITTELPFFLGFDNILVYERPKSQLPIPAWKLYFKDDRLVLINLSSYVYSEYEKVLIGSNCKFGATPAEVLAVIGKPDIRYHTPADDIESLCYHSSGVDVLFTGGVLTNFLIYAPLNTEQITRLHRSLNNRV
jgi:hypothetical protein